MTDEKAQVRDLNAPVGVKRVHTIVTEMRDGEVYSTHNYPLGSDEPVTMPMEHALKLLHDPAFEVKNAAGERLKPVKKRDPHDRAELTEDETVAQWDELSQQALYARAKVYAGSEGLKVNTEKVVLIAFLKAAAKRNVGVSRGSDEAAERIAAAGGAVPKEHLDKMFPPAPMVAETNKRHRATA